jgi:hypothetical protein
LPVYNGSSANYECKKFYSFGYRKKFLVFAT